MYAESFQNITIIINHLNFPNNKSKESNNVNFNILEPFSGLFTQGMVCHETYKDPDNNWVSPDEIENIDGALLRHARTILIRAEGRPVT